MKEKTKVIVIGLDGATWDLIEPWTDTHFGKLMEEGAGGMLSRNALEYAKGFSWDESVEEV
jgi:predicted AlkP superfamily phosphohydrolase/phosphomutase